MCIISYYKINKMKSDKKISKQESKKRKQQRKLEEQRKEQQGEGADKGREEEIDEDSSENADIDLNKIQEGEVEDQVEIDFLIGEINDEYYHSLKTILLRMGQISKTTNSELADAIVENKKIGNVSLADDQEEEQNQEEQDDQENVYSVLTVLPGQLKVSKSIKKTVLQSVQKQKKGEQLKAIIQSDQTSVLINERLSNLPAFIVSSAHEVFKSDMMELKKKQKQAYKNLFSGYLVNISEIQYEGSSKLQEIVFSKFQDYEMCKRAKHWWLGEQNQTLKKKTELRNLYYVISAEEYFKGVDNIKSYLE